MSMTTVVRVLAIALSGPLIVHSVSAAPELGA
jgi:hypothetical protein